MAGRAAAAMRVPSQGILKAPLWRALWERQCRNHTRLTSDDGTVGCPSKRAEARMVGAMRSRRLSVVWIMWARYMYMGLRERDIARKQPDPIQ